MSLRWGNDDDTLASSMGQRSSAGGYDHEAHREGLLSHSRQEGRRNVAAAEGAEAAARSAQAAEMRQRGLNLAKAIGQSALIAGTAMKGSGGKSGALSKKSAALEAKATALEGAGGSAEHVANLRTRAAQVGGQAEVAGLRSKFGRGRKLFQPREAMGAPGSGGQADILEAIDQPTPTSTPGVARSYTTGTVDPMVGIREWQHGRARSQISQAAGGTNPSKGTF